MHQLVKSKSGRSLVLVVGDAMRDVYYLVDKKKASEMPTWNCKRTLCFAGGASNTTKILRKFGLQVATAYSTTPTQQYPTKNRVVPAEAPYLPVLLRFDQNDRVEPCDYNNLQKLLKNYDHVVVSDYNKGTLTDRLVDLLNTHAKFLYIDTKRDPLMWRPYNTVFFPNQKEYIAYKESYSVCPIVIHKKGRKGASVIFHNTVTHRTPLPKLPTPACHTIGAGDSFIAAWVANAIEHGLDDLALLTDKAATFATLSCTLPFTNTINPSEKAGFKHGCT